MRVIILAFVTTVLAFSTTSALQASRPGLRVARNGVVMHEGKPFRGIGVNYFSAFYRTLLKADDHSYDAGFAALQTNGIPFCRMMGGGFWPTEQKLYMDNKGEFFRRFDGVVRSAEKHHIGLIPSLFWNLSTVPDLVGEPVNSWGDPNSKTGAYMRQYVRDVVTRYRSSPAIWGWEFGNEFNLAASLPNASQNRPSVAPQLGTPTSRSERDELTYENIRAAFGAFAVEVRKYDPYRIISTGDSVLRESAWHNWKEKSWTADTPVQMAQMLQADNPAPVDVTSVHVYGDSYTSIGRLMQLSRQWKKPLFVGEFGSPGVSDAKRTEFGAILKAIEDSQVPLAILWVYDFSSQDADWNVTATNARAYQLQAIADANRRIRASMKN
ncbi:MAG: hypothetical protein M3Y56_03360 [Armatimonadota bacterium]|nr:hypothetical protein [Armatimonadota bacterium]